MEVSIRPKNFKMAADIDSHIRKRMERLPRHLDNLTSAEAILSQEPTHLNPQRVHYRAQITLNTGTHNLIRSEVTNTELLTAFDEALDHVSRQIERFKGRHYRRHKGAQGVGKSSALIIDGGASTKISNTAVNETLSNVEPSRAAAANGDGIEGDGTTPGDIVRVKRFDVMPMFPEEAVEQMELLGHNFFLFFNAGEEQLNVLYRRKDGQYGLLQPSLG